MLQLVYIIFLHFDEVATAITSKYKIINCLTNVCYIGTEHIMLQKFYQQCVSLFSYV